MFILVTVDSIAPNIIESFELTRWLQQSNDPLFMVQKQHKNMSTQLVVPQTNPNLITQWLPHVQNKIGDQFPKNSSPIVSQHTYANTCSTYTPQLIDDELRLKIQALKDQLERIRLEKEREALSQQLLTLNLRVSFGASGQPYLSTTSSLILNATFIVTIQARP